VLWRKKGYDACKKKRKRGHSDPMNTRRVMHGKERDGRAASKREKCAKGSQRHRRKGSDCTRTERKKKNKRAVGALDVTANYVWAKSERVLAELTRGVEGKPGKRPMVMRCGAKHESW